MKPSAFEYHRPGTVDDAVDLLSELDDAKVLAGGQSLVPLMNFRLAAPAHLIDITGVTELRHIDVIDRSDGTRGVEVGAGVTHAETLDHAAAGAACPLLHQALALVAHAVIRNRGTVCGSLAHADPAGELPAVLALLEGHVHLASTAGRRRVDAADFFVSTFESSALDHELVTSAFFPRTDAHVGTAFVEVARRHGDYAMCGAAATVGMDGDRVTRARLALIAVAPTPLVIDASPVVEGLTPDDIDRAAIYRLVTDSVRPGGDLHATADYRRHLAGVLAGRAVADAVDRAGAGP
ncbi:MAG: FAD binding domain-containing protein [Acidimicrobiales bacterium]